MRKVLAFDLGGTKCAAAVLREGRVDEVARVATGDFESTFRQLTEALAPHVTTAAPVGGVSCGGPLDAEMLRQEYQRRLDMAIAERSGKIRDGQTTPDTYVVHGARAVLEQLRHVGLTPVILSSTVEERVREEASLLGLTKYFGRHIYGGTGDPMKFSKMAVFQRLLREGKITGANLLSFGDGPVELHHTKELGGLAVAVASDETEIGSGKIHEQKRTQLIAAGADLVIPDYQCHEELVNLIFDAR
mgnify:CR=1 FL=1